jgi:hypothetical protein
MNKLLRIAAAALFLWGTAPAFALNDTIGVTAGSGKIANLISFSGGNVISEVGICDATTANQCAAVSAGGAVKVDNSAVTQPVSGTVTANLGTLNGASTAAKQPALGTAGTPSADVITIQGAASMTKLLVTPDSVALPANQSINMNEMGGTAINSGCVGALNGFSASIPSTACGVFGAYVLNTNNNGQATAANSSPVVSPVLTNAGAAVVKGGVGVVNGGSRYQAVAASQTAAVLQSATGATGDYLSHCVIYPATTSPGVVTVFDNTNTAANSAVLFAGGATSVSNLAPIPVPVGAISRNGAWEVTTGANVSVVCYGSFS